MILASVALEHRLIDQRMFVALIVMSFVTSVLSGPIMHRLIARRDSLPVEAFGAAASIGQ
jgi:hypothetical protein